MNKYIKKKAYWFTSASLEGNPLYPALRCRVFCELSKASHQTSLVAQWMGICLLTHETWVSSLAQEISTCCRAAKPVHPQLLSSHSRAHEPHLPKPMHLETVIHNNRSYRNERLCSPQLRVAPTPHSQRKPTQSNEDPVWPKERKDDPSSLKKKKEGSPSNLPSSISYAPHNMCPQHPLIFPAPIHKPHSSCPPT